MAKIRPLSGALPTLTGAAAAAAAAGTVLALTWSKVSELSEELFIAYLGSKSYFFLTDFAQYYQVLNCPKIEEVSYGRFYNPSTLKVVPCFGSDHYQSYLHHVVVGKSSYEFFVKALTVIDPRLLNECLPQRLYGEELDSARAAIMAEANKASGRAKTLVPPGEIYRVKGKPDGVYNIDVLDFTQQLLLYSLILMGLKIRLSGQWAFDSILFGIDSEYVALRPQASLLQDVEVELPDFFTVDATGKRYITTLPIASYMSPAKGSLAFQTKAMDESTDGSGDGSSRRFVKASAALVALVVVLYFVSPTIARKLTEKHPDSQRFRDLFLLLSRLPNPFRAVSEGPALVIVAGKTVKVDPAKLAELARPQRYTHFRLISDEGVSVLKPEDVEFNADRLSFKVNGREYTAKFFQFGPRFTVMEATCLYKDAWFKLRKVAYLSADCR